jgi:hypothetical protein
MPKEKEPTTILSGVIGIPMVRVVIEPHTVIEEIASQITKNGMQQASSGRLSRRELESLHALQRAQRKAALGGG